MAIGNMFQGMARGKVGDVVFAVRDGKQVSRVRNRRPKNPKTNKQMLQRAVMATVLQAYSAGRAIFDHSFQGKSVGEKNQRAFLSKNAKLLRSNLAAEIEAGTAALNCNVAVVAPGAINPVPNEYIISEGTYPQNFFAWDNAGKQFVSPSPSQNETIAQYAERNGLVAGDLYTFCVFVISDSVPSFTVNGVTSATTSLYKPESQFPATFAYLRLQVKDVASDTTSATDAPLSKFFEVTAANNAISDVLSDTLGTEIVLNDIVSIEAFPAAINSMAAFGVIRSRLEQDLRSTSFMHVANPIDSRDTMGMYGITSPYALLAWQQGAEDLGNSDLILEGGDE